MTKAKTTKRGTDAERIIAGLRQAAAHVRGETVEGLRVHIPAEIDVRAIRGRLKLSQTAFADQFGFSVATVRDWEQGRRVPDTAARVLLKVIDKRPDAVIEALEEAG